MKILDEGKVVPFSEVLQGQVFRSTGRYYMRIRHESLRTQSGEFVTARAVELQNGTLLAWNDNVPVEVVPGAFVVGVE